MLVMLRTWRGELAFVSHVARVCTNAENMEHDADTSEETQAGNEAIPLYDHPKV